MPLLDRLMAGDLSGPDHVRAEMGARVTTQSPTDLTRTDMRDWNYAIDVNNPGAVPLAIGAFVRGDPQAAARLAGVEFSGERTDIARTGFQHQHGLKLQVVEGNNLEATAILEAGIDDVTQRQPLLARDLPPANDAAPPPALRPETLVVVPREGLTLRDGPGGARASVFQHGTFLERTGEPVTGADGKTWVPVRGTDLGDKPVAGFVQGDYVRGHDAAKGAMDEAGRTNPTLEHQRHDEVAAKDGDNLWDLARKHNVSFDAMVALNRDHLIAPDLIFKGDKVYLPGTARGPAEAAPPPAAPPPAAASSPVETSPAPSTTASSGVETSPGTATSGSEPSAPAASGSESGSSASSTPAVPAVPLAPTAPSVPMAPAAPVVVAPVPGTTTPDARPSLDGILVTHQVASEGRVEWRPKVLGVEVPGWAEGIAGEVGDAVAGADVFGTGEQGRKLAEMARTGFGQSFTATEARLLDSLSPGDLGTWFGTTDQTGKDAVAAVAKPAGLAMDDSRWINDGHVDATRHALWNARLTRDLGEDWTAAYATGHEKAEGNPAAREAMDLYNNQVGRSIAASNPRADDATLSRLVRQALDRGELLVIDRDGALAWSDQVVLGQHGQARAGERPGDAGFEAGRLARDPTRS